MIRNKLAQFMADKKMRSINQLAKEIQLDRRTLSAIYDEKNKGIDYDTLIKLCRYFQCDVGDLLHYEEGEK
jgi:putative transcriptional regulator